MQLVGHIRLTSFIARIAIKISRQIMIDAVFCCRIFGVFHINPDLVLVYRELCPEILQPSRSGFHAKL